MHSFNFDQLKKSVNEQTTKVAVRALHGTHRLRLALPSLALTAYVFLLSAAPTFAQTSGTGGTLKTTGDKIFEQLRTYGLVLAGTGFGILVVLALILITFSGIKREWKQKGVDIIKMGVIGVVGLALLSLILPAFFDLIGGLGGDKIDGPSTGK